MFKWWERLDIGIQTFVMNVALIILFLLALWIIAQ